MKVLEVENLRKSFRRDLLSGRSEVLKGVQFSLSPGSITAFLGANGAGKTTTIKCALSLLRPDDGKVVFFGGQAISKEVKRRIGFLPERAFFYEYLTGVEFLRFYGELSGRWNSRERELRIKKLLERVGLGGAGNQLLRHYSKGMLQKVGLAQALIHDPDLIILDEPMSGLDPDGRVAVSEIIGETAKNGAAVFFSSHLINDAEKLCDHVVMLKDGRTLYEGRIETLLKQSQRGFQLQLARGDSAFTKTVSDEADLQAELRRAMNAGENILEVLPIRMSLEEIFVSKAMRGGPPL